MNKTQVEKMQKQYQEQIDLLEETNCELQVMNEILEAEIHEKEVRKDHSE